MNDSAFKKYNTLSKLVYTQIRDDIISLKYKNGEKLSLKKLSDKMNVSITPIRDALNELNSQGIVKIIPNKGAMVEIFTFKDLIEIYDLREQFENLAITYISNMENNVSILNKLDNICKKDLDVLKKNDIKSHVYYLNEFHNVLIKSSNNKRLIKAYSDICLQSSLLLNKTIKFTKNPEKSIFEHKDITKAIREKKLDYALDLLNCHMKNVKSGILKEVKQLFNKNNEPFNLDIIIN